jgi:alkaline phosphatase D
MDRRGFLSALGAMGGGLLVTWQAQAASFVKLGLSPIDVSALRTDSARVFDLSVASADPSPTGVVLWTHIAATAWKPDEPLYLQVGRDARFQSMALQARVDPSRIGASTDYTVRVDLDGHLAPGGSYWYRFIYDGTVSRAGRCRTAPAPGASLDRLKFALLTCQDYTNGYYGALNHIVADDSIDFVLHLGDFIYETSADPRFQDLPFPDRTMILPSGGTVALNLADYRFIYRTVRNDPNMQALMERHTLICVPDDHETANDCYWDYARDTLGAPDHPYTIDPQYGNDPALLRQLKLDSQRAWSEYVPARVTYNAAATHPFDALQIYRRFSFGSFLDLFMIENRSYRSPHPCGEGGFGQRYAPLGCAHQYSSSDQTLLGATQHDWLVGGLTQSHATWKLMGNQTFFGRLSFTTQDGTQLLPIDVDAWDGYQAERRRLTTALREARVRNFLIATGDLHTHMASHIKHDWGNVDPLDADNFLGAEFMTPSLTSATMAEVVAADAGTAEKVLLGRVLTAPLVRMNNPHVQFFDSSRQGYSTLELTDSYADWVSYAVDKSVSSGLPPRNCIARQRKYMAVPWLLAQSTLGY